MHGTELEFRRVRIPLTQDIQSDSKLSPREFKIFAKNLTGGKQADIVVAYRIGMILHFLIYQSNPDDGKYALHSRYNVDFYQNETLFAFGHVESKDYQSLILAQGGRVEYLPLIDGKVSPVALELLPHAMPESQRSAWREMDFTVDCDGDGWDELALPDLDGPVLWRRENQNWTTIELPGITPREYSRYLITEREAPLQGMQLSFANISDTPLFFFQDYDHDGLLDLFLAHDLEQTNHRRDPGKLKEIPARIEVRCFHDDRFSTEPDVTITAVQRPGSNQFFCDMNADGAPDRIESWASGDPVSPVCWLRVYLAKISGDNTMQINSDSDFVIRAKDPTGLHFFPDINRDGLVDIFQTQWNYTIGSHDDLADIFLGQKFTMTLEGFIQEKNGRWPERPQIRRRLRSKNYDPGNGFFPRIDLEQDFDGDGTQDLAFLIEPDRLHVYRCDLQGMWFDEDAMAKISLPPGRLVSYPDVNHDNRADILTFDMKAREITLHISQ